MLPLLLPRAWVARKVGEQICLAIAGTTDGLIVDVNAEWTRIGWGGIHLADLRVRLHHEQGTLRPVFSARRFAVDFSPLNLLRGSPVEWIELDEPHVHLQLDADRSIHVAGKPPPASSGGPFPVRRLRVSDARIHVDNLLTGVSAVVGIQRIDARLADRRIQLEADLLSDLVIQDQVLINRATSRPLAVTLDINLPPPSARAQLAGSATLSWQHLDLQPVDPLPRHAADIASPPTGDLLDAVLNAIMTVRGSTSGSLNLHMDPQSWVHFELDAGADALQLADRPVGDVRLRAVGRADPFAGALQIDSITLTSPILHLDAPSQAGIDPTAGNTGHALLNLRLKPRELLDLAAVQLPGTLEIDGLTALRIDLRHTAEITELRCAIDLTANSLHAPELLHKPAGMPMALSARAALHTRADLLDIEDLRLNLPGARANVASLTVNHARQMLASAGLHPAGSPDLRGLVSGLLEHAIFRSRVDVTDLEQLARVLPAITQADPLRRAGGAARVEVDYHPVDLRNDAGQVALRLSVDAEQPLHVEPWIHKPGGPRGRRLDLAAGFFMDHRTIRFTSFRARAAYGQEATIDFDRNAAWFADLGPAAGGGGVDYDLAWRLPLRIDRVEDWISLSPAIADRLEGQTLRGTVQAELLVAAQGEIAAPRAPDLVPTIHNHRFRGGLALQLDACQLAIQRPEDPAGVLLRHNGRSPLRLSLDLTTTAQPPTTRLLAALQQDELPGNSLHAELRLDPASARLDLHAELAQTQRLITAAPWIRQLLEEAGARPEREPLAGPATARLHLELSRPDRPDAPPGQERLHVAAALQTDFEQLAVRLPGWQMDKPAGMGAALNASASAVLRDHRPESFTLQAEARLDQSHLNIHELNARHPDDLAGLALHLLTNAPPPPHPAPPAPHPDAALHARFDAQLSLTDALRRAFPKLSSFAELALGMAGQGQVQARIRLEPDALDLAVQTDLDDMGLAIDGLLVKPAAVALNTRLEMSVRAGLDAARTLAASFDTTFGQSTLALRIGGPFEPVPPVWPGPADEPIGHAHGPGPAPDANPAAPASKDAWAAWQAWVQRIEPHRYHLRAAIHAPDISPWAEMLVPLQTASLRGGLRLEAEYDPKSPKTARLDLNLAGLGIEQNAVSLHANAALRLKEENLWLDAEHFSLALAPPAADLPAIKLAFAGRVLASPQEVRLADVSLDLLDHRFRLAGRIERPLTAPDGLIALSTERLDAILLAEQIDAILAAYGAAAPAESTTPWNRSDWPGESWPALADALNAHANAPEPPGGDALLAERIDDYAPPAARVLFDLLRPARLQAVIQADSARFHFAGTNQEVRNLYLPITIADHQLRIRFLATKQGGSADGFLNIPLDQPNPPFHLYYAIRDSIQTRTSPVALFPGLWVYGPEDRDRAGGVRLLPLDAQNPAITGVSSFQTIVDESKARLFGPGGQVFWEGPGNWHAGRGLMVFGPGYLEVPPQPALGLMFPGLGGDRLELLRVYNWFDKSDQGVQLQNLLFIGRPTAALLPQYVFFAEGQTRKQLEPDPLHPGYYLGQPTSIVIGLDLFALSPPLRDVSPLAGRLRLFSKSGFLPTSRSLMHPSRWERPNGALVEETLEPAPLADIRAILTASNPIRQAYEKLARDFKFPTLTD